MSANTAFLNLYKPGGGSSGLIVPDEVVDIDRINGNMDLIDAFASSWGLASRQTRDFTGPAASLASIVAAAGGARLGDTYQETDSNKRLWKYDGGNWASAENGLYLIRPTSVTNGTINPDGTISVTAQTSVAIDGIFSARFRHAKIIANLTASSDTSLVVNARNAGVTTSSGYNGSYQEWAVGVAISKNDQAAATFMAGGRVAVAGAAVELDCYNWFQAAPGHMMHRSTDNASYQRMGGHYLGSASFDGISLGSGSAVTLSGTIKVLAYAGA